MIELLIALALQAAPETAPALLTDEHRSDMRCAAAFAIIASEQERGVASSLSYPPLGDRGKRFFADTGEKVMADTGMSREEVRDALTTIVSDLQGEAMESNDPVAVVDAVMTPCLARLNAVLPPPEPPSTVECAAALTLAYEEVYGREGLSPTAQDLKTLASVLESRARDEMRAEGLSGNEADQRMIETKEAMFAKAMETESAGLGSKFDFEYCFELAAP